MSDAPLLTSADLDALGMSSFTDGESPAIVAQLVAAVAENRLADPEDTGYALLLAAGISERQGDLDGAAHLTDQATALARGAGDDGWARSVRARLLARSGRDDEALAAFTALRPLLVRDPGAAAYLSEAMAASGHATVAEQWLTAALAVVLERPDDGPDHEKVKLAYALLQARHRLRRELDLPQDPYDDLADRMRTTADDLHDDHSPDSRSDRTPGPRSTRASPSRSDQAEVFWPAPEFDRMLLRWPALAEVYGPTWDAHRTRVETALVTLSSNGTHNLGLIRAATEDLLTFAARTGADPAAPATMGDYIDYTESLAGATPWPPARNDACWCGSAAKYKKCCLRRSRT